MVAKTGSTSHRVRRLETTRQELMTSGVQAEDASQIISKGNHRLKTSNGTANC